MQSGASSTCFRERENVAYLALELAACGSSMMLQRLGKLGHKMGERQSLIGSLSRSTRSLRMSAASLISPSIKARVSGQVGSNLLAFVATCPRSEAAAVDAAATGSSSLSIAGVVEAISMCGVDEVAMARLHEALVAQSLAWLGDGQIRQLQLLAVFVLLCVLDSGLRSEGALSHFASYRLFCEGMGLLPLSSRSERWIAAPAACQDRPRCGHPNPVAATMAPMEAGPTECARYQLSWASNSTSKRLPAATTRRGARSLAAKLASYIATTRRGGMRSMRAGNGRSSLKMMPT